jgi:hypothetical protein
VVTAGNPVTITATLSGTPTPTGVAQLVIDHVSSSGLVTVTGGVATFTYPSLTLGTHSIGINYSGDVNYAMVFDAAPIPGQNPIIITVVDPTTTSLVLLPAVNQPLGTPLLITGHVAGTYVPLVSSGNVQITVDGSTVATLPVTAGGDFSTSYANIPGGVHTVLANYLGNSTWGASTGGSASNYQVTRILPPLITITTSPVSPAPGAPFNITLTLGAAVGLIPTGQVQLVIDHVSVGGLVTLAGGSVTIAYPGLTGGTHTYRLQLYRRYQLPAVL